MWINTVEHGISGFHENSSSYQVFRNVMDFGCKGDGVSDDTSCINMAISSGGRCGANCGSSTVEPGLIYFPSGRYLISSPILMYYYSQLVGNAKNPPILVAAPGFSGTFFKNIFQLFIFVKIRESQITDMSNRVICSRFQSQLVHKPEQLFPTSSKLCYRHDSNTISIRNHWNTLASCSSYFSRQHPFPYEYCIGHRPSRYLHGEWKWWLYVRPQIHWWQIRNVGRESTVFVHQFGF